MIGSLRPGSRAGPAQQVVRNLPPDHHADRSGDERQDGDRIPTLSQAICRSVAR